MLNKLVVPGSIITIRQGTLIWEEDRTEPGTMRIDTDFFLANQDQEVLVISIEVDNGPKTLVTVLLGHEIRYLSAAAIESVTDV